MDFHDSNSTVRVGVYLHSTREELVEVTVPSEGILLDLTTAIANHPDLSKGGCFADDPIMVLCRGVRRLWVRKSRPDHHEDSSPLLVEVDLSSLYGSVEGRSKQKDSAEESVVPPSPPSQPPLLLADYGIGEGSHVYVEGIACCEGCRTAGEAEHAQGCVGDTEQPAVFSSPSVAVIVGAVITDMGQVEADLRRQLAEAIRRGEEALSQEKAAHSSTKEVLANEKAAHRANVEGNNSEISNLQSRLSTAQSFQRLTTNERDQLRASLEATQRELRQLRQPKPKPGFYDGVCYECHQHNALGPSGKCDGCFYADYTY